MNYEVKKGMPEYKDERELYRKIKDLMQGHWNFTLRESRYHAWMKQEMKKYHRAYVKMEKRLKKNPKFLLDKERLYMAQIRVKLVMEFMDRFIKMGEK